MLRIQNKKNKMVQTVTKKIQLFEGHACTILFPSISISYSISFVLPNCRSIRSDRIWNQIIRILQLKSESLNKIKRDFPICSTPMLFSCCEMHDSHCLCCVRTPMFNGEDNRNVLHWQYNFRKIANR